MFAVIITDYYLNRFNNNNWGTKMCWPAERGKRKNTYYKYYSIRQFKLIIIRHRDIGGGGYQTVLAIW